MHNEIKYQHDATNWVNQQNNDNFNVDIICFCLKYSVILCVVVKQCPIVLLLINGCIMGIWLCCHCVLVLVSPFVVWFVSLRVQCVKVHNCISETIRCITPIMNSHLGSNHHYLCYVVFVSPPYPHPPTPPHTNRFHPLLFVCDYVCLFLFWFRVDISLTYWDAGCVCAPHVWCMKSRCCLMCCEHLFALVGAFDVHCFVGLSVWSFFIILETGSLVQIMVCLA